MLLHAQNVRQPVKTRWDSERKLLYDDIIHVLQSTIDSRINSATDTALSQCLRKLEAKHHKKATPVKLNLNDKLKSK